MRLRDKRILITGAASGIGLACARTMAADGAVVLGSDIDRERLINVAGDANMAGTMPLDVSDENDWIKAVSQVRHVLGGLDAIVHSAGIGVGGELTTLPLENWQRQQAVNLDGSFLAIKHMVPMLRQSGGGSVILIASVTVYGAPRYSGPMPPRKQA